MRIDSRDPPRRFAVGNLEISDCATIEMAPDEQVTFLTNGRAGYDVTRKDWGWYATPSLNGRLIDNGLRSVIVRNEVGRAYLLLVNRAQQAAFEAYLASEKLQVLTWLDSDQAVAALAAGQGA